MKASNLYAKVGLLVNAHTMEDYVGYYNVTDDDAIYSGRVYIPQSVLLQFKPEAVTHYAQLKKITIPPPPTAIVVHTSTADRQNGYMVRYFARRSNMLTAPYIEVDEKTYSAISRGSNPLYVAVSLRWKICGPLVDVKVGDRIIEAGVVDTNARTLAKLEVIHLGLVQHLSDLQEFWQGA